MMGAIKSLSNSISDMASNPLQGIQTALNDPSKVFTDPTSTGILGFGADPVSFMSGGTPSYSNPYMQAIGAYVLGDYAFGGTSAAASGADAGASSGGSIGAGANASGYSAAADSNAASNAYADTFNQNLGVTNSTLADSNAGTPGYGASSASQNAGYVGNGVGDPTGGVAAEAGSVAPAAATTAATSGGFGLKQGIQGAADLYSIYAGSLLSSQANAQNSQFDQQRALQAQSAQQMAQLQANPSIATSLPGYQSGLSAMQRSLAATGQSNSGAALASLAGYGQNFYNNQMSQYQAASQPSQAQTQAQNNVLGAQSMANKSYVSAGLNLASLFA